MTIKDCHSGSHKGVTEESWEVWRISTKESTATVGISTLIRHLLRKFHLPQGEGFITVPIRNGRGLIKLVHSGFQPFGYQG